MTTTSIARPAQSTPGRRPQHRRGRHPSPHALQLRQQWRPRLGPAARVGAAAETYLIHVVLWCALLALLAFGLTLDAHAAAYGAATLTGFFRRRPVEDPAVEDPAAGGRAAEPTPPTPPTPPASPVALDDPLADPADDGLGVPVFATDDDPPPLERTDVIPTVRRSPARPVEVSTAALQRRAARLEADVAERDRVIERGGEQLQELADKLRAAELDRDEADRAAGVLRRALDHDRPSPDARQLAERLKAVWLLPASPSSDTELRWRRVAQAAIDAVRGLWPIERWPLTDAERRALESSPGGGAAVAESPPAAEPSAPGGSTAALAAAADSHLEDLSLVIARRDLELTGGQWPRLTDLMREHYRHVAADVVNAGWRPPVDDVVGSRGRVDVLARVLTDHEQLADGACRCGWAGVAIWHAEHVAKQLLAAGVAR